MLSSLIVLSTLLGSARPVHVQNPQFPKPDLTPPAALQDNSIFKYLSEEDKLKQWKPLEVGRDWSNLQVPDIKPDAVKIKILLAVAERDFSNPEYSNTLEMRDKTRLIEASARLKSLFAVVSDGGVNIEIVPRFIPEPIFDINEFKQLVNTEFNRSKFESDDTLERGPFAAVIALSSSHIVDSPTPGQDFMVHSFATLGGSSPDMWFEEALFYIAQAGICNRIQSHFDGFKAGYSTQEQSTLLVDRLATFRGKFQRLFDPNFRQDGDLVAQWAQQPLHAPATPFKTAEMAAIQAPAAIASADGVLTYSELSILRAGEFTLPASDKWASSKTLKFEARTKGRNAFAVKFWKKDGTKQEVVLGNEPGMISLSSDYNWQTFAINFPSTDVIGATIGVPSGSFGKTRVRAEVVQCEFKNFELGNDVATPPTMVPAAPTYDNEGSIREALTTGNRYTKRRALSNVDLIKGLKGLEPDLLNACSDLDAGVAHDAGRAYFELVLSGTPTTAQLSTMTKFLTQPPNESIRALALTYVARNPAFGTFDAVIACTVRENWRVRRDATIALGALMRAGIKEKEGCHQSLLLATSQEMATIRAAAVFQLDPAIKVDAQRLEYLMVNDPCEMIRLSCLRILSANNSIPKEKILGSLADDSPSLRERIATTLGIKSPLLREALQKMVVDQDPYVRLFALRNLASLGEVKEGEIQSAFADKHPAVQIAVLQGAANGAWKIPADALEKLKQSPIPVVKALAEAIK